MQPARYALVQDRAGMIWDLLLYVPTVAVLGMIGLKLWYGANQTGGYLLFFMASFFFIAGANRILKTRLMLLPNSPVAIQVSREQLRIEVRNGASIDLVKDLRYYPDTQGKSLGLSGTDVLGRRLQFILHRGQFPDQAGFDALRNALKVYQ